MQSRNGSLLNLLAGCGLLLGVVSGPASAQLAGPEFQVNTYTPSFQRTAAVAADSGGNFVVVWETPVLASDRVSGQRFDAQGTMLGGEFPANSYTSSEEYPALVSDSEGNFVIAWQSYLGYGASFGIFGHRFDSVGVPTSSVFQVSTYSPGAQQYPAMASTSSGAFVVVWESEGQDGSGYGVFGRLFNSTGQAIGGEFQVNSYTTGYQFAPAVAVANSGSFIVVWATNGQDSATLDLRAQRFDTAGTKAGSEFRINSYTTGHQQSPAVAVDGSGTFTVVWESTGQDGSAGGVFGRRFSSVGVPLGGEFRVNTTTLNTQGAPSIAASASGDFVVVWEGFGQDGSDGAIVGRRFHSAGSPAGSEFLVNTFTTGWQQDPSVASDGSGDFVVVWSSMDQDGSTSGVFGQRLANSPLSDGFESGDPCAWSSVLGGGTCP